MIKFIKTLIGIALLPACWAVSVATYNLYRLSGESVVPDGLGVWSLPAGFMLWVVIFFLLPRPSRTYVLGHELTHAMWALMMGGSVGKLKVDKNGGVVELSKSNFVIGLSPYFFPFYTFFVIAGYYLAGIWLEVEPYMAWWLGAVGFTWAFHITFTLNMLAERQPDIHAHGRIFSYTIIYLMNALVIGVWMVLVGDPKIGSYSELLAHEHAIAYKYAYQQIVSSWFFVVKYVGGLNWKF